MRTSRTSAAILALWLVSGPIASAAMMYNFNVLYRGLGVAELVLGSDDPNGVNLAPGDSFKWTILAEGSEFWRVDTTAGYFPLMAFLALPGGTRTGDFTLTLRNGAVEQFSESETGAQNSFVHVGTNTIDLTAGLEFDEMYLEYTLTSAVLSCPDDDPDCVGEGTDIDTLLSGLLPIFGAPEQNPFYPGISYIDVVPLPAAAWLLLSGLAGLGALGRRRAVA